MIPVIFYEGIREIMVIDRSMSKNNCLFHKIVQFKPEYDAVMDLAIKLAARSQGDTRVYMSINSRSMTKAIKEFKKQNIEADYSGHSDSWYFNLDRRFRHILMQPKQRKTKYFLLDIDTKSPFTRLTIDQFLKDKNIHTIASYETPNGEHIITEPFNMNMLKIEHVEVKTDGLMILYWNRK